MHSMSPGSLSFAKLVMMSSAPVKSVGDARSIQISYSRNNVCKRTVFPKLELRRRNVIGKPLSWNDEKHSYLHTLFLEYETQMGEKKYWTMFFNQIAVHMHKLTNLRKTA